MKALGVFQEEHVVRAASRRKGVTAPEIADHYDVSRQTAWNTLERLVRQGKLIKTTRKRRRWMLFRHAGQGSWIYVANPGEQDGD